MAFKALLSFLFWMEGGPWLSGLSGRCLAPLLVRGPRRNVMEKCHTIAALCPGQRNRQDCWTGVLVVVQSKLSVISVTLLEQVRAPASSLWVRSSSLALALSVNDQEAPSDKYNTFSRHSYYVSTGNQTIYFEVWKLLQPTATASATHYAQLLANTKKIVFGIQPIYPNPPQKRIPDFEILVDGTNTHPHTNIQTLQFLDWIGLVAHWVKIIFE